MESVNRVHGPGTSNKVLVSVENDRLCGSGRFSNVYRAVLTSPVIREVAIKNVWDEKPPLVKMHPEIEILSQLNHQNIVLLLYHFTKEIAGQKVFCLILNYMPEDMAKLLDRGVRFDKLDARLYSYQLFSAVAFLAKKKILHLDIKPANLLVNHSQGILQLSDFGNAQLMEENKSQLHPYQVTRYYRAPEIVFGTQFFVSSVDTWAATCCAAEFILGQILFKGKSSEHQMKLLIEVFGYPTTEDIQAMRVSRPRTARAVARGFNKEIVAELSADIMEIIQRVLVYNPKKRSSAEECLKGKFFDQLRNNPKRSNGKPLPSLDGIGNQTDSDSGE